MSTVEEIEQAIDKLSKAEVAEINARLFDRQIARDAEAGILDDLAAEALKDLHEGRARPL
jgi:hypothetical protein